MTQPKRYITPEQLQEERIHRALRLPRHHAERVEVESITTSGCPPIVRSGSLDDANSLLRKVASVSYTEAQLMSGIEEALGCGFPDVTATYRRLGSTCSSSHLWTVHCRPADS